MRRKDRSPIRPHVHDDPAVLRRLIKRLVKLSDLRRAIVGVLAFRVGVVHDEPKTRAVTGRRPLKHLQVAIGVAEGHDRTPADDLLDGNGLAFLVVDKVDLRRA